jgi:hypothetical protein
MPKQNRYAYELVENALDSFVRKNAAPDLINAYKKLKMMILAYATIDFGASPSNKDNAQAYSWAWEDLHITFTGYGESAMTGPVLQLWDCLSTRKQKQLQRLLTKVFEEAEASTDRSVARRYLSPARNMPVRLPSEGYDLPPIIPNWGPSLEDWAMSEGGDPAEAEKQLRLIEMQERMGLIRFQVDDDGQIKGIEPVEDSDLAANDKKPGSMATRLGGHLTLIHDSGADA